MSERGALITPAGYTFTERIGCIDYFGLRFQWLSTDDVRALHGYFDSDGDGLVSFDEFIKADIPDGDIIVAACMDDCISNMSEAGKEWLSNLGSEEIDNLEYR